MDAITVEKSDGRIGKIFEFLSNEGFRPEKVSEDSIKLKYEGGTFWVDIDDDDKTFYRVIAANIWNIESPLELSWAYVASNNASRAFKVVKTFVTKDESDVWVTADQFESDVESFLPKLIRLLRIVEDERKTFGEKMRELKMESNLNAKENVTLN